MPEHKARFLNDHGISNLSPEGLSERAAFLICGHVREKSREAVRRCFFVVIAIGAVG